MKNFRIIMAEELVGEVDLSHDSLVADASREKKGENTDSDHCATEEDPLIDATSALRSIQEALETEVQKLGEAINTSSTISSGSTSVDMENYELSLPESQNICLIDKVKGLQNRLNEVKATLKVKESRLIELEKVQFTSTKSLEEESGSKAELQPKELSDTEYEDLLKQKTEAEIEYRTLKNTIRKLEAVGGDGVTAFKEQEALADVQAQALNKLRETEAKAETLKKRAEDIENSCDVLTAAKVSTMRTQVLKVSACFFTQLILFSVVSCLVVLSLSPFSRPVVPT